MLEFKIGQNALDVCKVIVDHHSEISKVRLIAHEVGLNWRQVYQTTQERSKHILETFDHKQPIKFKEYSREEFLRLKLNDLYNIGENQVWSFTSKIQTHDGNIKHIPMMNFHPEDGSKESVKKALKYICGDKRGVLLYSGRFWHYYGDFILDIDEWIKFMSQFLMQVFLVSPRYIAHRLYDGYCTLRLTTDKRYKPHIPTVIEIL
jgi:hypothetical protein